MFATLEEKAIVAVLALLAIGAGVAWLEHVGAARCEKADQIVEQKQQTHNAAVAARDTVITHEEASSYAASAAAPVPNPVHLDFGLCNAPDRIAVPSPAPARPLADVASAVRAPDHRAALPGAASRGADPGPGLQAIGQDADARVAGLQDYITRVCLAR